MLNWTGENLKEMLKVIIDPELHINIVDLGLVYDVEVTKEMDVNVTMTLTNPGCPIGPDLTEQIKDILGQLPGLNAINVEFVWSPRWDPHVHASEEGRLELGIW